jgi:hypothetical protein
MRRREFITLLSGTATTWPLMARAQQGKRMRRVGVLMPYAANDPQVQTRNAAFLQGLQQLGWTVGNNVQIDYRWSGGRDDDTPSAGPKGKPRHDGHAGLYAAGFPAPLNSEVTVGAAGATLPAVPCSEIS